MRPSDPEGPWTHSQSRADQPSTIVYLYTQICGTNSHCGRITRLRNKQNGNGMLPSKEVTFPKPLFFSRQPEELTDLLPIYIFTSELLSLFLFPHTLASLQSQVKKNGKTFTNSSGQPVCSIYLLATKYVRIWYKTQTFRILYDTQRLRPDNACTKSSQSDNVHF